MATGKTLFILPLPLLLKMNRTLILLSALVSISLFSSSQTNISGIVNSYYKVIEVIPAKACVRLSSTTGLAFNDKAMIIQMKGATINTSDPASSSFGDTVSLNNAGNYEIGTICYIIGDSVFFVFHFLNQYTVADKVQLVKIPQYYSATVTDTLKAAPWNNTTGTGGVLAIWVDQDLVLNAPVYADSSGFRGGSYRQSNGTCSNSPGANMYAYNGTSTTPQNGAYKGEGIADVLGTQSGGRGAPANGGGGGNNHNNGGAGGANLSTGGDGGGNSSSGAFNCTLSRQGKGGKALSSYGGKKIFPGGGGGAGHVNNGFAGPNGAGHGGGIIFIRSLNLTGNGNKISSSGQVGGAAASDGASGGGAGGTIILNVANYIGTTTIAANGGQGGTTNDGLNINYCYGAGGGGSGGAIYYSGAIPPGPVVTTSTGGSAGPELFHDVSCNAPVPSSGGAPGQTIPNYTYSSSLVFASTYCSILLPVELLSFSCHYNREKVILNWKIVQPESLDGFFIERSASGNAWTTISEQPVDDGILTYHDIDQSPPPGYNYYRIRIVKKNNAVVYSTVQKIWVPSNNETIQIYPNPAGRQIIITGISSSPELKLFDMSGKCLWQKKIITNQTNVNVDLPSLPQGVYMIKVNEIVKRLVIR